MFSDNEVIVKSINTQEYCFCLPHLANKITFHWFLSTTNFNGCTVSLGHDDYHRKLNLQHFASIDRSI